MLSLSLYFTYVHLRNYPSLTHHFTSSDNINNYVTIVVFECMNQIKMHKDIIFDIYEQN
jgi:hypothetical protein